MTLTHICHTGNDDNDDDTPLIPAWILFLVPPLLRDMAHKPLLKFPCPETREERDCLPTRGLKPCPPVPQ